ncbi:TetR/AcrR family transcriptional regulator [Geodermatophilus sp. URMC 64]
MDGIVREKRRVGRPAGAQSGQTREALVWSAVEHFAREGLARTTLRDVAEGAGLTQGTLYHHFSAKSELYMTAYVFAVEQLYARFREAVAEEHTLRGRLSALLDCMLRLQAESPYLMVFILRAWVEHESESEQLPPLPIPASVTEFLARLSGDAVDRGEIAAEDVDDLIAVFRSIAWGVGVLALTSQQPADAAVRGFKRLFANGLIRDVVRD